MKNFTNFYFILLIGLIFGCNTESQNKSEDSLPPPVNIFQPDSASIADNYQIPEWFRDAKFGIFIHWGVYSVPAFGNEWYPRNMYRKGSKEYQHHLEKYGNHTEFGYKDFIPMFKAEMFDAKEWIALFKQSGAKYLVPVAEHHDGFALYDSKVNEWNSIKMGPKRDIIGELKSEAQSQGLHFGLSSHRAENAWFFNGGKEFPSDVTDPKYASLYGQLLSEPGGQTRECPEGAGFNEESKKKWTAHINELIDMYQPELIWLDWTVGKYPFEQTFYEFLSYYYNRSVEWEKEVVVNTKFGYGDNIQVFDIERGKSEKSRPFAWQTDTSIGKKSWGYIDGEENKTPNQIIDDLVDIVSKNGNLLLNIGPRPDGTITQGQKDVLLEIGKWLQINGEAIYDTRPWTIATEGSIQGTSGAFSDNEESKYTGQDIRFTSKGDVLYATTLAWPEENLTIKSIDNRNRVKELSLLGSDEKLEWTQSKEGLKIKLPKDSPTDYAHSLKITFDKQ